MEACQTMLSALEPATRGQFASGTTPSAARKGANAAEGFRTRSCMRPSAKTTDPPGSDAEAGPGTQSSAAPLRRQASTTDAPGGGAKSHEPAASTRESTKPAASWFEVKP